MPPTFLQLDFDVDAGRQIQLHQGIHCFVSGVHDIHQTAMGTDLELVARRFVDVGRTQDIEALDRGRQRNRALDHSASALGSFHDFERRLVDQFVVKRLQADADFLVLHCLALLFDLGHDTRTDGTAAFADGETQTFVHGDRGNQRHLDADVVTRHDHLGPRRQFNAAGDIGGAEIELRTVAVEERGVTTAFVLAQHVDLGAELGVRLDGAGLGQNLAALDLFTLGAAQQDADVVAGLTLVEQLPEHLDAGAGGLEGGADADNLDLFANLDDAALDTTGDNGAATGDGEDVFNRHQEGLVDGTLGLRDVGVEGVGQLHDGRLADVALVAFEGLQGGTDDDGGVVAGEVVLGQEFADLHFDELKQFGVVDHVGLVHVDDDVGHANLTGQQDVLAGLGHGAVGGGHDQDGAVHLGCTGNHVLDVVGVAGAVDVGVVTLGGLVLDVGGVDGDAARLLFGRGINLVILLGSTAKLLRQNGGDRRGQGGLAVVNVSNGANVYVRLGPLEFFLSHFSVPYKIKIISWR